jgi:4-hydroxybenzoate polyprenyltransferase
MEIPSTLDDLLILGYVVCCMGLNVVAFLISAFYKKKINRNAPYLGFLLSLLLGAVFVGTFLVTGGDVYIGILRTTALLGCSMSSTFSIVGLFLSMNTRR